MSSQHSPEKLWGAVLLKNKLVTEERLAEAMAAFKEAPEGVSLGDILFRKGYITAKIFDVVGRKVDELVERQGGAPPSRKLSRPATDEDGDAPAKPVATSATSASAAPARPTPPPAKSEDDDGTIGLADDGQGGGPPPANWRPSDAEWVESSEKSGPAKPAYTDEERIPLEEAKPQTTSKIIKEQRLADDLKQKPAPAAAAAPAASKAPAAAKPSAPAVEISVSDDPNARIECPVAPNDMDPEAFELLTKAVKAGASDLHLASGTPPFMRLNGALTFVSEQMLTAERAQRMVLGFMNDQQQQVYLRHHDLDFAFEDKSLGRFRVNALEQFRGPDIIFRIIPWEVPTLASLNLPESLAKFTDWHQGLVLVTGPAGCGKSTTAAALIDVVNSHRKDHVITVEDPIEYLHKSKGCNVTQRQVPTHTKSFATALKAALREDPDVIMIGEMRDLETVSLAIRAAETGHLVIGTLQTKSAARTIDRVVDVFPADQQSQIRTMLSESLRGIISQQLVTKADGTGRIPALEVLHVTVAVSNLIRDSKTFQLPSLMQTGRKIGQRLMDDSLLELVQSGKVKAEDALPCADNPKRLQQALNMPATPART